jgi:hypothetical protein
VNGGRPSSLPVPREPTPAPFRGVKPPAEVPPHDEPLPAPPSPRTPR